MLATNRCREQWECLWRRSLNNEVHFGKRNTSSNSYLINSWPTDPAIHHGKRLRRRAKERSTRGRDILSCLTSHMYALPAFAGHLTADDRNRINHIYAISRKALHRGVTHTAFDIAQIINKFHRKLFSQIIHPGHCLYHLLPPKTPGRCHYSPRERQHSFQLSDIEFLQFKNSFINRYLFNFRWLHSALQSCVLWILYVLFV